MKICIFLFLTLIATLNCRAQYVYEEVISKSPAINSRTKADSLLTYFDNIKGAKLLYSILDKEYYIIIKDEFDYKEYYVNTDSLGEIINIISLENNKEGKMLLSYLRPFEFEKYHTEFITNMPDAKYIGGNNSYFVIIDEKGKRYGEYCLSLLTLPIPIEGELFGYLLRQLTKYSPH